MTLAGGSAAGRAVRSGHRTLERGQEPFQGACAATFPVDDSPPKLARQLFREQAAKLRLEDGFRQY